MNYNLREIPETYTPLKQQLYEYLDNWNDTKEGIEEETDVFILLSWYILWYVLFQYFLQPNDFHQIEEKYQELIKLTEFRLRTLSKKLMPKQLLKVKKIMDSFPSYINPFSKKKIINYCRAIVQKLKLWTPNEIIYAMGWFFPSMKT